MPPLSKPAQRPPHRRCFRPPWGQRSASASGPIWSSTSRWSDVDPKARRRCKQLGGVKPSPRSGQGHRRGTKGMSPFVVRKGPARAGLSAVEMGLPQVVGRVFVVRLDDDHDGFRLNRLHQHFVEELFAEALRCLFRLGDPNELNCS